MAALSGTTKNAAGQLCSRLIRAFRRADGKFVGAAVSDPTTGEFSISGLTTAAHVIYEIDGVVTQGDPNWGYVTAALHMDGADGSQTFVNEIGPAVTVTGTAKLSTDANAFGGVSALFDGTISYLTVPVTTPIGTGDFTITFWYTPLTVPTSEKGLFGPATGNYIFISCSATTISCTHLSGKDISRSYTPVVGTRYYIEVTRVAGKIYLFVNGVAGTSATSTVNCDKTSHTLGAYNTKLADMPHCRIDDFKIARIGGHIVDYTPPTGPFLNETTITPPSEPPLIFDNVIPI